MKTMNDVRPQTGIKLPMLMQIMIQIDADESNCWILL